jgi:peptide/nickel transport system permease protein
MTEIEPEVEVSESAADVRYAIHLFRRNPLVLAGLILSVGSIAIALLSHLLVNPTSWQVTHPSLKNCWDNSLINWGNVNIATCPSPHVLGTDSYGRDLLKMIILAIPVDLQIALEVVLSAVAIGIALGATASYAGGIVDEIILRVTDIFLAVPGILLAIVFMVVFGRSLTILTVAVMLIWWPTYVRLVRSQVLSEKERPYVESLRSIGAGRLRILFRHIVPNSIYPLLVQATLDIGSVILTVSALTFIGLSPSPLLPELGNLASLGSQYFFTAPWLIIFPGLTILLISLGFNLLGDGLRDILDPRLRR